MLYENVVSENQPLVELFPEGLTPRPGTAALLITSTLSAKYTPT